MGNWTVDELWAELDKLYKNAEKRGDYRMMREILFMKAKTLGLMQDGVAPVVNVFAVMDTKAACRTYNILTAEGRKVIAAILVD